LFSQQYKQDIIVCSFCFQFEHYLIVKVVLTNYQKQKSSLIFDIPRKWTLYIIKHLDILRQEYNICPPLLLLLNNFTILFYESAVYHDYHQ